MNPSLGARDQGATDARAKLLVQKEIDNVARGDSFGFHRRDEPMGDFVRRVKY